MPKNENAELKRVLEELRRCVRSLSTRHGDHPAIRRFANSAERLEIDAADLPPPQRGGGTEVVYVPDTPYDAALWHDVDDEGVGGHRQHVS
jgi:hypothetical protein